MIRSTGHENEQCFGTQFQTKNVNTKARGNTEENCTTVHNGWE
jgi:hypothetical protein